MAFLFSANFKKEIAPDAITLVFSNYIAIIDIE